MTPLMFAKLFAATAPVLLVLDYLWLGVIAKKFYRAQMGSLLRTDVQLGPALLFYLLFITALLVLAVQPALERESAGRAVLLGALLGLVAYGAYDLVNLATLRGFPLSVAIVDMAWGTAVSAVVAGWAFTAARWLG